MKRICASCAYSIVLSMEMRECRFANPVKVKDHNEHPSGGWPSVRPDWFCGCWTKPETQFEVTQLEPNLFRYTQIRTPKTNAGEFEDESYDYDNRWWVEMLELQKAKEIQKSKEKSLFDRFIDMILGNK